MNIEKKTIPASQNKGHGGNLNDKTAYLQNFTSTHWEKTYWAMQVKYSIFANAWQDFFEIKFNNTDDKYVGKYPGLNYEMTWMRHTAPATSFESAAWPRCSVATVP